MVLTPRKLFLYVIQLVRVNLSWISKKLRAPFKNYSKKKQFKIDKNYINLNSIATKEFSNKILVLRLDDIGDYILFRQVLPVLNKHCAEKNLKLTLCGNIAWKPLFESLDAQYVSETIWINKKEWVKQMYRNDVYKTIATGSYGIVLNCEYSRNQSLNDLIAYASQAPERYAWSGELNQNSGFLRSLNAGVYTHEFTDNQYLFESERNVLFVEQWMHKKIPYCKNLLIDQQIKENKIMLFSGASKQSKRWSVDKFIQIANFLHLHYPSYQIVLAGDQGDIQRNKLIQASCLGQVVNTTGTTSLIEFVYLAASCSLIITNDTLSLHIAASCDTPCIVIANGATYTRFLNYPASLYKVRLAIPPKAQVQFKLFGPNNTIIDASSIAIQKVTINQVINYIYELLKK